MTIESNYFRFVAISIQFFNLINELNFSNDSIFNQFQSLASVSLQNIPSHQNICSEFLDIQSRDDGITVPEIHKWTTSGAFGFIFHAWIRLDEVSEWESDPYIDSTRYRRVVFR